MIDPFLTQGMFPFTLSLALLFGLMLLELVFAMLGGTLMGKDGPDLDGPDLDAPEVADFDLDLELDGLEMDLGEFEGPEFNPPEAPDGADAPDGIAATGGVAGFLGLGKMPLLIWIGCMLFAFGSTGLVIQSITRNAFGFEWPWIVASVPAAIVAVVFTRKFGMFFARMIPKTETQALSERHLGRRPGVITQGTAARGKPAEVRVTDRYGNTHYLRAEPLRDDLSIPQGSEVIVLRHRRDGGYLLVPLNQ
ncbi:OB-fold-containig protein [Cognatishimia sp. F0-27]|uniref:OB-fold-containig protein n=1 Tax=Cognatishimia sp. F0-27 TaxID=2816855 RepID=UPI001D0BFF1C|nr:OB-fold-containig protein [Cognatishimia sp. F0-27]MCC1491382.1 DUF1449 family protein [Cognatishimia sp. F0-27]